MWLEICNKKFFNLSCFVKYWLTHLNHNETIVSVWLFNIPLKSVVGDTYFSVFKGCLMMDRLRWYTFFLIYVVGPP